MNAGSIRDVKNLHDGDRKCLRDKNRMYLRDEDRKYTRSQQTHVEAVFPITQHHPVYFFNKYFIISV
jgi:hypothetical protein